jgi:hypothetical protein
MKKISPKIKSTVVDSFEHEWVPSSFDNLLIEIDHIVENASKNDALILYRGQADNDWLLDSTFVRNSITSLFKINNYFNLPQSIREQVSFHRSIASLFLMKFDKIIQPSREAIETEKTHGIDSYYELLKHIQQHPEKYSTVPFIQGTNLIDWTINQEIALFFGIFEGQKDNVKMRDSHGSLWIYDASSTGKILQTDKMQKTLNLMTEPEFLNAERSLPLMFHPRKQTNQERAINQRPIYIAQMDFRYDLADIWANSDKIGNNMTFIKIHILKEIKKELAKHLEQNRITEDYVFPI